MANVKTTLDTRRAKSDGTFNVIFRITHIKKVYTINSGVSLQKCFWNIKNREVERAYPNSKLLNIKLSKQHFKIEQALLVLDDDFTIEKLKNMLSGKPINQPAETFQVFSNKVIQQMFEAKRTGNAMVYKTAVDRLINYCGRDVSFSDINYQLLDEFKHYLLTSGLKQNSIANYFRSIRAIYNKAIKLKVVDRAHYPFYDITIKSEKTSKRAISKEELQKVAHIPLEENSTSWRSLNYFLLSFFLRGISFTDLAYLKHSNIIDGRIEYKRRKTHKNYSVKLFGTAETIINKFCMEGHSYLLPVLPNDIIEDSIEAKKIISQWIKTTNKYLKRFSIQAELSTPITTYTSRHSFATIAKRLGYSNELIAEALGHEYGNKITNIYLDTFDTEVLDQMHYNVMLLNVPAEENKNVTSSNSKVDSTIAQKYTIPSKSDDDKELKAKLSEFRLKLARKEGLRAFRVFSNATLEGLITLKPTSREELLNVRGIAEMKFDWFGKQLLSLIHEHLNLVE